MPELPDINVYCDSIESRMQGEKVLSVKVLNPFLLRTVEPAVTDIEGRALKRVTRLGKRLVLSYDKDLHMVIHLMIAGRFRWIDKKPGKVNPKPPGGKLSLMGIETEHGFLYLTEAGSKRRASVHMFSSMQDVKACDRGGLEVQSATLEDFSVAVRRENHTLKRTLTDPRILSGIGNAYSDEILHRARLSPMQLSSKATDEQLDALHKAIIDVLSEWTSRLKKQALNDGGFPKKVTAFRPEMAVHGKHGEPCPVCGETVQRIVYAKNETNYCARCQTQGKILKDRALSRLLKDSWPKHLDD